MKLWVRSQDKSIFSEVKGVYCVVEGDFWAIYEKGEVLSYLGLYKTRERCLEIIDEIQKILGHSGMILFKNIDITHLSPKDIEPFKTLSWFSSPIANEKSEVAVHNAEVIVYEMPEK